MASYFDEHDCEPLGDGQTPNHLLHLARLLRDMGMDGDFERMFLEEKPAPPASKRSIEELENTKISQSQEANGMKCPVCLLEYEHGEGVKGMPCGHKFHPNCLLPWLKKTNSCPVCRHELPTDDPEYEALKKQKEREKQRKHDLDALHDSMYG